MMKKLTVLVLAVLLTVLAMTPAVAESLRFGTVNGASSVNLRGSASLQGTKLGEYDRGTWLRILGEGGDWYRVTGPDGKTGWMMKKYVYISATAKGTIGIVDNAGYLNLRKEPSYSAKVLGQYDDGTPCILLSQTNGWYHVTVDGKAGYFAASYIDKEYTAYSSDVATITTGNGGSLRLRTGPGTQYSSGRSFKNGSYVMILQKGDDWWKVAVDGYVGYMDASCLTDGIVRKSTGSTGSNSGSTGSTGSTGNTGSNTDSSSAYALVSNPGADEKLNLRASASRSSKSLGKYGNGTRVTILSEGTQWCKVKVDGKIGYMMTDFLTLYNASDATSVMRVDHPDKTFVYLRKSASQSTGRIMAKVPHGSEVTVLSPGKTWTKVRWGGYTGYMMTKFLDD